MVCFHLFPCASLFVWFGLCWFVIVVVVDDVVVVVVVALNSFVCSGLCGWFGQIGRV